MTEKEKPNVDSRQEAHSVAVDTANPIIRRIIEGMLKLYGLGTSILVELQNICGAMNRIAEATEEGNRYLRNISDDCKGDTIDKLDFRSEIRKEVHGIYGNTSVIQAEVSRIKSGIKEGKFKV